MEISLTLSSMIAMFGAMYVLAIIPDANTFAVVGRSIGSGFTHAIVTTIGIVTGDLVFIILAFYGLSSIAESSL
jgi:threonine/homoserine/homoserine lactone efflux protein